MPQLLQGSDDEDGGGGWQQVTNGKKRRGKPTKDIPVKTRTVTEEDLNMFSETYMKVFEAFTGKRFEFRLTADTYKYVSMLPPARELNRTLSTLFQSRPRILDCTGGSGANAIAFLMDLDPELVVVCSRACAENVKHGPEFERSQREFQIMQSNLANFQTAFKTDTRAHPEKAGRVRPKHQYAHDYIQSAEEGTEFDMIFLDPSWDDDHDGSTRNVEMTPEELFKHLETDFWAPIKRKNIAVGCYVIKTRWDWRDVREFLPDINKDFTARYCIRAHQFKAKLGTPGHYGQRKGIFYYMVLVHNEYQTINFHNGQAYWDIVNNEREVWIQKSTQTGLIKPNYTNTVKQLRSSTEPQNEALYLHIQPVIHDKKRPEYKERMPTRKATYRPARPDVDNY